MGKTLQSPLPWMVDTETGEIVVDAQGAVVVDCGFRPATSHELAVANAILIQRAATAHSLLVCTIETAAHALRSYQHGNSAPDLAKEIADHCDAVLAQMEAH